VARLYDEILEISRNYMGLAAEDYIRRRIRIVLHGGQPESIEVDRLDRLAAGIDMTARGYMSENRARTFRDEVLALKNKNNRSV
jgi:hypothetical protein